jgi:hypothetical protein
VALTPPLPYLQAAGPALQRTVGQIASYLRARGYNVNRDPRAYVGPLPPAPPGAPIGQATVYGEAWPDQNAIAVIRPGATMSSLLMHEILHDRPGAAPLRSPAEAGLEEGSVDAAMADAINQYLDRFGGQSAGITYPREVAAVRKMTANVGGFGLGWRSAPAVYYRKQLVNLPDFASRQALIQKWTQDNIRSGQARLRMN